MFNMPLVIDSHTRLVASRMLRSVVAEQVQKGFHLDMASLRYIRKQALLQAWALSQNHYRVH